MAAFTLKRSEFKISAILQRIFPHENGNNACSVLFAFALFSMSFLFNVYIYFFVNFKMSKVEQLIEIVKNHKILYDMSHSDYKNIRKKDKVWDDIGLELGESGEELKKKWKNLRDTFAKYIRSIKTKTGQAATQKNWIWSQQMDHFRPYLAFAKTSSNVEILTPPSSSDVFQFPEDSELACEETYSTLTLENSSTSKTNTEPLPAKRCKRSTPQSTSAVNEVINYLNSKPKKVQDDIDILFAAHAQTVKKFSLKRQALVKFKIAKLIMEEELEHLEEEAPIITRTTSVYSLDSNCATSSDNCQYVDLISLN